MGAIDWEGQSIRVRKSKSDAGTLRRPPIPTELESPLRDEHRRQGEPVRGRVLEVSVTSFRLAQRADEAWGARGLERITLLECRHTYATWLMASGHTLKDLVKFMGHADLGATARYVKLLPLAADEGRADRLNAWLDERKRRGR